ncbi:hypothetical protein [uncultured Sphingobacterium sp.]|uniref:hypothetical protein n=1 Tax=uncultured Sphingobacterium sp. TaxID=182688 RepID=UPI0025921967|nr:hypothetical protein [uncultured Sphingobacterium sp.]
MRPQIDGVVVEIQKELRRHRAEMDERQAEMVKRQAEMDKRQAEMVKRQAEMVKHQADMDYNMSKLRLSGTSSSSVAHTAENITDYHVDFDEKFPDFAKEISAWYKTFTPYNVSTEKILLKQFLKHFDNEEAKLCLVDTHNTYPIGMTKRPDAIIVRKKAKQYKSGISIIGVVELKKENDLDAARGQVIKDMMELIDLQPKRTSFIGVFANKTTVGFLRLDKTIGCAKPFKICQSKPISWQEGS